MWKQLVLTGLLSSVAAGSWGQTTYDLATDWSTSENPNGVWSLNQGSSPLPSVANFNFGGSVGINVTAWAPSNSAGDFLPAFFQANALLSGYDWAVGDVVVHTTDSSNGASSGIANVTWTAPTSGVVNVSGDLWDIRNLTGRGNTWTLLDGTTQVATGTLADGDGHTSSNPETFSAYSLFVNAGTVLTLDIASTNSTYGEMAGLNFTVVETPVPLPAAAWLMLSGLGGLATVVRKRRAA